MTTLAIPLTGSGLLPSEVLSVLAGLPYVLVVGGLFFGILAAAVRLSRSGSTRRRGVAVFLGLVFAVLGIFLVQAISIPANSLSLLTGPGLLVAVVVGLALLVIAIAIKPGSLLIARLAGWSQIITVASLALGALGIIGWTILNGPVQAISQGGIRIGDYQRIDQMMIWTALRDRGPIAAALLAAALGAVIWRVGGRARGSTAALVGCVGLGLNLWMLFLQSGD